MEPVSPQQDDSSTSIVGSCGNFVSLPKDQIPDFYRGHRYVLAVAIVIALIELAFAWL